MSEYKDKCEEDRNEFIAEMLKQHVDHMLTVEIAFGSKNKDYTLICKTCADEEVMWASENR